ncbi:MAG: DNA polymerase IV [Solirubrobacterales bacterium]
MRKIIFLVDMNSFFISCETLRHPEIKDKPAAVAGDPKSRRGIILTANYEARKFGVKTTMPIYQAKRLCPSIILIPPDHSFYIKKSEEVMNLLNTYTPLIEQNSIDEAWLDMTGCEALSGKPMEAAKDIMKTIMDKLGLPCSIGISENKFLSKMASEMKKPMGITQLLKEDIPFKMWPLSAGSMYGVGKQTAEKLKELGINTIGDIASSSKERLIKTLGKFGGEIYELSKGNDQSQVVPRKEEDIKSIGRSVTLGRDIINIEDARLILLKLSEEISASARKHEKKGRTVQINIKYSDFKAITRQTSVKPTFLTNEIYSAGVELLEKNWNNQPVRLLGISITGFSEDSSLQQLSMFQITEPEKSDKKLEKLEGTLDIIREKYGDSIIRRAVFVKKDKGEK